MRLWQAFAMARIRTARSYAGNAPARRPAGAGRGSDVQHFELACARVSRKTRPEAFVAASIVKCHRTGDEPECRQFALNATAVRIDAGDVSGAPQGAFSRRASRDAQRTLVL